MLVLFYVTMLFNVTVFINCDCVHQCEASMCVLLKTLCYVTTKFLYECVSSLCGNVVELYMCVVNCLQVVRARTCTRIGGNGVKCTSHVPDKAESATAQGVTPSGVQALLQFLQSIFSIVLTSVISRMGTMFPRYYINF